MSTKRLRRTVRLGAIALAAMAATAGAQAVVVAGGSVFTSPDIGPLGPGDVNAPSSGAWIGSGGSGSLAIDGGSFVGLARLSFGSGGNGVGSGLISGIGTVVQLSADGESQVQRLMVGDWGNGSLTVAAGAVLDTSGNQAPCLQAFHYCDSFVGGAAGDTALLTVTGAGTRVRIGQNLFVAQPGLAVPSVDGYTYGNPGGTTRGTVLVADRATLVTDRAQLGPRHWSTAATGSEKNIAEVIVSGAGSRWEIVGGMTVNSGTGQVYDAGASLQTANDRNAWSTLNVVDGGVLSVQGHGGVYNFVNLTNGGGRTDALVSGAGSRIEFTAESGVLQVGTSLGSATLELRQGGQALGVWYASVGRNGSFGTLAIDGTDSLFRVDGTATAAANGTAAVAAMDIGRGGGTGIVQVRNGGRLEIAATQARAGGPALSLGRDAASSGTLEISGAGSTVRVSAASVVPGGGADEAWNPFVRIGRDGNGTLNISGGGQLLVEGNAVSTEANTRRTSLFIGGSGDTTVGGRGVANVTGAGSALRVSGSDAYIGVGHGPLASGQLTLSNQAQASATILGVGNYGGTGLLKLDNARVDLSGQYTGQGLFGAALVIGAGAGAIGNATLTNGSLVRIENSGTSSTGVTIGGSRTLTGGDGSLTLSGASRLELRGPAGASALSVGRSGSGLLRLQDGSSIDLGGASLFVGRESGSDGTFIATGGSTVDAGWVGVGRQLDASAPGGSRDGGTGTMVLNGATLRATDIVIGTNGFLGGSSGAIQASGSITNYGIFSPGSSPGVFTIDGNYTAGAGSRLILEVESDGHGGFVTDEVHFGHGGSIDFGALQVEFRFLGATDPNAFLASGGFDIDTFVQQADASGVLKGLDDAEFAEVRFSARADAYVFQDFRYSAEGGASFIARPVPEPGSWALMALGVAALLARRRPRTSA